VNILTVDIERINQKIYEYIAINNEMPYIICSDDTKGIIISKCYDERVGFRLDRRLDRKDILTQYYGCTILSDNSLRLGEVKIR